MTKNLNDRFVAGIRSANRENIFDTKARGLVLRVGPRVKTWYFTYRHGGPTQWLRLGDYPALSLAKARAQALDHRHAIDIEGKDPAAEKRTPPPAPEPTPEPPRAYTFADFAPTFVAFQKGRKKTWYDDEAMLERYLLPAWGTLPLRDITRRHVHELLDAVAGKGLTVGVNRVQALISRVFTLALDRSLIDAHPAARMIKRFDERASTRVLSDDELRALWKGLDAHPGAASDAVRLRLLLGQRGEETAGMLWRELDLDAALWSLPGTRTKNKRPHAVPLPPTALTLLQARRKTIDEDEPRVFPAFALTSLEHKAISVIHNGAYEWKDLRRTVGTRLAELGFDETTRGRVLNHARVTVTERHYNLHAYLDETRRALTAWDTELQRILAKAPKKTARIVRMRTR
jgi:integrase